MKIAKGQAYKIIETPDHISIVKAADGIRGPMVWPLIIADREKLVDYLTAYLHQREEGKSLKDAHNGAMAYVGITKVIQ